MFTVINHRKNGANSWERKLFIIFSFSSLLYFRYFVSKIKNNTLDFCIEAPYMGFLLIHQNSWCIKENGEKFNERKRFSKIFKYLYNLIFLHLSLPAIWNYVQNYGNINISNPIYQKAKHLRFHKSHSLLLLPF